MLYYLFIDFQRQPETLVVNENTFFLRPQYPSMDDDGSTLNAFEQTCEDHGAFSRTADGYQLTTTVFDSNVTATTLDDGYRIEVRVTGPLLGSVVDGQVAPIVETDWFETFERRLNDLFSIAQSCRNADSAQPTWSIKRDSTTFTLTLEFRANQVSLGVSDTKALIEYIEGTYAQGLIPGYSYRNEAKTLLENAQHNSEQAL